MKVSFGVFNSNSIQPIEKELDSFRTDFHGLMWGIARSKPGLDYSMAAQLKYVIDKLGKNGADETKLVYYGINFMLDRITQGDIDIITNTQKMTLPFNTAAMLTNLNAGSLWLYYDTSANSLLVSLGKLFRVNDTKVAVDHDELLGFIIMMAYVINESDEFIEFVSSHKLVEVSSDLNIYWTLRYKKLEKEKFAKDIRFEQVFNMYLLGKQLPSFGKFKEEYTKAKHNYITISSVLKNWRRKNKKLLSCYVSDDEKLYLEYMLLSNNVDYKALKKFIYNK